MSQYLMPARGGRVAHIVENGSAIFGARVKNWSTEEQAGFTCGLCGSRRAIDRKNEKLKAPRLSRSGDRA
jgi:hypothetical protein